MPKLNKLISGLNQHFVAIMLFALPGLLQTCIYTLQNNKVLNVLRGCLYVIPDFMVTYTWHSALSKLAVVCFGEPL